MQHYISLDFLKNVRQLKLNESMEAQVLLCYVTKPAGESITAVIF